MKLISEETCINRINAMPNISFVRWDGEYKGTRSKAVCLCAVDGFEWPAEVNSLINKGSRCPQCAKQRRWTAEERISQINSKPNVVFVRWEDGYDNKNSKAICRCTIDEYERPAPVDRLISAGSGCPQCAKRRRWTADETKEQINALANISFVKWIGVYRTRKSKAVIRCAIDGHEWPVCVGDLLNGSGCPRCAKYGYDSAKAGTLYILRSECGSMVKIGISNDYQTRHVALKRATPFDWSCIELLHGDGATIAEFEKEFHSMTEQANFSEPFDGYTEWRKWDDRLPQWVKRHRARLERYNKAP